MIYIYIYIISYIYIYIYTYIYTCDSKLIHTLVGGGLRVHLHYTFIDICVYTYTFMLLHMYTIYIYICIYIYIYIYIHIYISYTGRRWSASASPASSTAFYFLCRIVIVKISKLSYFSYIDIIIRVSGGGLRVRAWRPPQRPGRRGEARLLLVYLKLVLLF